MKKSFLAMSALALVLGMALAGCDNVTTGGAGGGGETPAISSSVYESTDGSYDYKLEITASAGRAAYTPKTGDTYVLTITAFGTNDSTTSKGTVTVKSEGSFELKPSNAPATTFTVIVNVTNSGAEITAITGTITLTDNSTKPAPERLSRYSDGGPISGSNIATGATVMYPKWPWLTDYDADDAKSRTNFGYAWFSGDAAPVLLSERINAPASVEIADGKVTIKLGEPKHLETFTDLYRNEWEEFASPKGVKGFCFQIFVTSDEKYCLWPADDASVFCELVYVEKDVTIKGTWESFFAHEDGTSTPHEVVCDMSLTKGWNYVKETHNPDPWSTEPQTMTSSKSLPRGYRWSVWVGDFL